MTMGLLLGLILAGLESRSSPVFLSRFIESVPTDVDKVKVNFNGGNMPFEFMSARTEVFT